MPKITPDYTRYHDLQQQAIKMVRDYLLEKVYHDISTEQMAQELNIPSELALRLCTSPSLTLTELIYFLDLNQLNFGLFIRDPGAELEVSFLPLDNLHEDNSEQPQNIKESTVHYSSLDADVTVVDGDYDTEEEEETEAFFLEKEDRVVNAEFGEVSDRSYEEVLENQCENCLEEDRLEDSLLCYFCQQAGVQADDLDELELMARVTIDAGSAQENSRRLLEQANQLLTSGEASSRKENHRSLGFRNNQDED